MKILWLSNAALSGSDAGGTGTWLGALAQRLGAAEGISLGNVAMGGVRELTTRDCPPVRQWLVPNAPLGANGLPPRKVVEDVFRVLESFSPDLIHIWGVEGWWGLLNSRGLLNRPVLLEMQGIRGAFSRVFAGGLTPQEQRRCRGFKELILGRSIDKDRRAFAAWGRFEDEIISGCRHVATQTPWVTAWVRAASPECITHQSDLMLRQEFYDAEPWSPPHGEPVLFCSAAYPAPYKGLHDAIRATALLSRRFPKIRLRIAGAHQKSGFRQDGYVRWLNWLCDKLGVSDQVTWLGQMSANQIVKEYLNCSVFLMSSYIENCCTAMQEALYLGVPTVAAYVGGVPALACGEEAALYYPSGDDVMSAFQIERLLTDCNLVRRLSQNSRIQALKRNDPVRIVKNQVNIYRQVNADNKGSV